jgi:L-ribulose-5-phosphate 4-epimerase
MRSAIDAQNALPIDAHWEHRRKLAMLCRMVANQGYIGAFGHVSVRVPGTDIVLISPGAGTEKTTLRADQLFAYDIHGKLLHHPGGEMLLFEPQERPIHIRIHRDRPEIQCVAHLHSPHSTLLGIVNRAIVPVYNQAFYLNKGIPVWDNPRLVLSAETAGQLSQVLGDNLACQMRGHGSVVVGETPEIAFMNCITVEENARYQIAAEPFGGPVPFAADIVERAARERAAMGQGPSHVIWAYFERRVAMTGLPL